MSKEARNGRETPNSIGRIGHRTVCRHGVISVTYSFLIWIIFWNCFCCLVELKLHRPRVPQDSIQMISRLKWSPVHLTIHIWTPWTFSGNWHLKEVITLSLSAIAACRRWISANSFPVWDWLSKKQQHWRPLSRRPSPRWGPIITPWLFWVVLQRVSLIVIARNDLCKLLAPQTTMRLKPTVKSSIHSQTKNNCDYSTLGLGF